jgi:hypothetical protein
MNAAEAMTITKTLLQKFCAQAVSNEDSEVQEDPI